MGAQESVIRNTTKRNSRRENAATFKDEIKRFRGKRGHATGDEHVTMGEACGIKVCVRKRPIFPHETKEKEFDVITVPPGGGDRGCRIAIHDARMEADLIKMYMSHHSFKFDAVFSEKCTDDDVYRCAALPLVMKAAMGLQSTIMMYGQTGSGKTYTMTALQRRAFPELFEHVSHDAVVTVSFVELAGDKCCDMLNAGAPTSLSTAHDGSIYPYPCVEVEVRSAAELAACVAHANSLRATAATGVHDHSSRSHAVCRIFVNMPDGVEGQLTLVDLAGTEHRIDSDEHNAERRKEGALINASLAALKECIRANAAGASFIPYRNNRLTQLMRACFADAERHSTIIIATVSPSSKDTEHSLNTLRHACIMDGQGTGQAAGSSHLVGGTTSRVNLGSVDVGALGRAKYQERVKARAAGAALPADDAASRAPRAAPAHQAKQSNAAARQSLDRAGMAALPSSVRSALSRARDPENLRDNALQRKRLTGTRAPAPEAERPRPRPKKRSATAAAAAAASAADDADDSAAGGGGGGGGRPSVAARPRRRPDFVVDVPEAAAAAPSEGGEREWEASPPQPPPRAAAAAAARYEEPSEDELLPQPRVAAPPAPSSRMRNPLPRHETPPQPQPHPGGGGGGAEAAAASPPQRTDLEISGRLEDQREDAVRLWTAFRRAGRGGRVWRKNDLRLIATHVLPTLPQGAWPVGGPGLNWMSPECALDELEGVCDRLREGGAGGGGDPDGARPAYNTDYNNNASSNNSNRQASGMDWKFEAAKARREKQEHLRHASRANVIARHSPGLGDGGGGGGGSVDMLTDILQQELCALERRLSEGGSEATQYGLRKQIEMKKAKIKREAFRAKPQPPVAPEQAATPEQQRHGSHHREQPHARPSAGPTSHPRSLPRDLPDDDDVPPLGGPPPSKKDRPTGKRRYAPAGAPSLYGDSSSPPHGTPPRQQGLPYHHHHQQQHPRPAAVSGSGLILRGGKPSHLSDSPPLLPVSCGDPSLVPRHLPRRSVPAAPVGAAAAPWGNYYTEGEE